MDPSFKYIFYSVIFFFITPLVSGQAAGACPTNGVSTGVLIGSVIGAFVAAIILETSAILCYKHWCKKRPPKLLHTFITSNGKEIKIKERVHTPDAEMAQDLPLKRLDLQEKKQDVFSVAVKADSESSLYGHAIYRNPIATDKETGDGIMNGRHAYEPDLSTNFLYSTGWGKSDNVQIPSISRSIDTQSEQQSKDEAPILRGLSKMADDHVDFSSARFKSLVRQPMPQEWIAGMATGDDDSTTYRYQTGFVGKRRVSSPTMGIDNQGFVSSRPGSPTNNRDTTVVQIEHQPTITEARITIDDNNRPGGTNYGRVHTFRPAPGRDQGSVRTIGENFILRDPQRSDSSDEDLYDYGESEHSWQSIFHTGTGRQRHETGSSRSDRSADEPPTNPRSFRLHVGPIKPEGLPMQAPGALQARGETLSTVHHRPGQDIQDDSGLYSTEHTTYSVIDEDRSAVHSLKQKPVSLNFQTREYGTQCELLSPRPNVSFLEEWSTEFPTLSSRKDSGVPTIGFIKLVSSNSQRSTRSRSPDQYSLSSEEDDLHMRSRSMSRERTTHFSSTSERVSRSRSFSPVRRSRSASPVRRSPRSRSRSPDDGLQMFEDDLDDVPTIGIIRLMSETYPRSYEDDEHTSSSGISVGDSAPQPVRFSSRRHSNSLYEHVQQIIEEDDQMYNSTHELQTESPYDSIPTIGVLRLVSDRKRSQPRDRRVDWGSTNSVRTERAPSIEELMTNASSRTLHTGRHADPSPETHADELPTIGVIKLVQPNLLRQSVQNESMRNIHRIDRVSKTPGRDCGTQTLASWASLVREDVESTASSESRPNSIGIIKLTTPKSSNYEFADEVDFARIHKPQGRRDPVLLDSSTEPAVTWPQLISTVKELVEEELSYTKTKKAPRLSVFKLKSTKQKPEKVSHVHQGTDPDLSWERLVTQMEEEIEVSVTRRTQQLHEQSPARTVSIVKLQAPQRPQTNTETRGTQPDITWNQLVNVIRDETEEIMIQRQSVQQRTPTNVGSIHLKAPPKAPVTDSATQPELTWPQLVRIIQEEVEDIVTRSSRRVAAKHDIGTQPEIDWNSVIHLVRQDIMTQIQETRVTEESSAKRDKTPLQIFKLVGSEDKTVSKQDQTTGPEFTWGQIVRIIRNETEEIVRRDIEASAEREVKETEDATTEPELAWPILVRIVQQETEEIVRKNNLKNKSDTATSPHVDWSSVVCSLEETVIEEYKKRNQKEQPTTVGIFKLKANEPVVQEKQTGDASTEPELTWPVLLQIVQQEVEEILTKRNTKRTCDKATNPGMDWRTIVGDIEETAIEEFKRVSRRVTDEEPPMIGIFKLKAEDKVRVPSQPRVVTVDKGTQPRASWDRIISMIEENAITSYREKKAKTDPQVTKPTSIGVIKLTTPAVRVPSQPRVVTVDKGTQPRASWDRIISMIEENAITSYREKKAKTDPQVTKPTSIGVIKLTTPAARKSDSFTQSDDPDLSDSFTQPATSWRDLLRGLKEELESEYIKTIRELEAHIASQDETDFPDSVQSLGVFTLKAPGEKRRPISDSFTQIFTPSISEKSTQPETSWPQLINEIEESTEMRIRKQYKKAKVTQGTSQTESVEEIPITPVIIRQEFVAPPAPKTTEIGTQMVAQTATVTTSTQHVPQSEDKAVIVTPEVRDAAVSSWKISSRSFITQFDAPVAKSQHAGQQTSISVLEKGSSPIKNLPCFAGVQVSPAYESHSTSVEKVKLLSSSVQVSLKKDTRDSGVNTVTTKIADAGMSTESPHVAENSTSMDALQTRDACVSVDLSSKKQVLSFYMDQLKKKPKMQAASIQCDLLKLPDLINISTQYDQVILDSKATQHSLTVPKREHSSTQYIWPTKTEGSLARIETRDAESQAVYEPPIVPVQSVQSEMSITFAEPPKEVQMVDASTSDDLIRTIDHSTQIHVENKDATCNTKAVKLISAMAEAKPSVASVMSTVYPSTQHVSMYAVPDGKDFTQQTQEEVLQVAHTGSNTVIIAKKDRTSNTPHTLNKTIDVQTISGPTLKNTAAQISTAGISAATMAVSELRDSSTSPVKQQKITRDTQYEISTVSSSMNTDRIEKKDHKSYVDMSPVIEVTEADVQVNISPEKKENSTNTFALEIKEAFVQPQLERSIQHVLMSAVPEGKDFALQTEETAPQVIHTGSNTVIIAKKDRKCSTQHKIQETTGFQTYPRPILMNTAAQISSSGISTASMTVLEVKNSSTAPIVQSHFTDVDVQVNITPENRENSTNTYTLSRSDSGVQPDIKFQDISTNTESVKLAESSAQVQPSLKSIKSAVYPSTKHISTYAAPAGKDFTHQAEITPVVLQSFADVGAQVEMMTETEESGTNTYTNETKDLGIQINASVAERHTAMERITTKSVGVSVDTSSKKQVVSYYLNQLQKKAKVQESSTQCDLLITPEVRDFSQQAEAPTSKMADLATNTTIIQMRNTADNTSPMPKLTSRGSQIITATLNASVSATPSAISTHSRSVSTEQVLKRDQISFVDISAPIQIEEIVKQDVSQDNFAPQLLFVDTVDAAAQISPGQKDSTTNTRAIPRHNNSSTNTIRTSVHEMASQVQPTLTSRISLISPDMADAKIDATVDGKDFAQQVKIEDPAPETMHVGSNTSTVTLSDAACNTSQFQASVNIASQTKVDTASSYVTAIPLVAENSTETTPMVTDDSTLTQKLQMFAKEVQHQASAIHVSMNTEEIVEQTSSSGVEMVTEQIVPQVVQPVEFAPHSFAPITVEAASQISPDHKASSTNTRAIHPKDSTSEMAVMKMRSSAIQVKSDQRNASSNTSRTEVNDSISQIRPDMTSKMSSACPLVETVSMSARVEGRDFTHQVSFEEAVTDVKDTGSNTIPSVLENAGTNTSIARMKDGTSNTSPIPQRKAISTQAGVATSNSSMMVKPDVTASSTSPILTRKQDQAIPIETLEQESLIPIQFQQSYFSSNSFATRSTTEASTEAFSFSKDFYQQAEVTEEVTECLDASSNTSHLDLIERGNNTYPAPSTANNASQVAVSTNESSVMTKVDTKTSSTSPILLRKCDQSVSTEYQLSDSMDTASNTPTVVVKDGTINTSPLPRRANIGAQVSADTMDDATSPILTRKRDQYVSANIPDIRNEMIHKQEVTPVEMAPISFEPDLENTGTRVQPVQMESGTNTRLIHTHEFGSQIENPSTVSVRDGASNTSPLPRRANIGSQVSPGTVDDATSPILTRRANIGSQVSAGTAEDATSPILTRKRDQYVSVNIPDIRNEMIQKQEVTPVEMAPISFEPDLENTGTQVQPVQMESGTNTRLIHTHEFGSQIENPSTVSVRDGASNTSPFPRRANIGSQVSAGTVDDATSPILTRKWDTALNTPTVSVRDGASNTSPLPRRANIGSQVSAGTVDDATSPILTRKRDQYVSANIPDISSEIICKQEVTPVEMAPISFEPDLENTGSQVQPVQMESGTNTMHILTQESASQIEKMERDRYTSTSLAQQEIGTSTMQYEQKSSYSQYLISSTNIASQVLFERANVQSSAVPATKNSNTTPVRIKQYSRHTQYDCSYSEKAINTNVVQKRDQANEANFITQPVDDIVKANEQSPEFLAPIIPPEVFDSQTQTFSRSAEVGTNTIRQKVQDAKMQALPCTTHIGSNTIAKKIAVTSVNTPPIPESVEVGSQIYIQASHAATMASPVVHHAVTCTSPSPRFVSDKSNGTTYVEMEDKACEAAIPIVEEIMRHESKIEFAPPVFSVEHQDAQNQFSPQQSEISTNTVSVRLVNNHAQCSVSQASAATNTAKKAQVKDSTFQVQPVVASLSVNVCPDVGEASTLAIPVSHDFIQQTDDQTPQTRSVKTNTLPEPNMKQNSMQASPRLISVSSTARPFYKSETSVTEKLETRTHSLQTETFSTNRLPDVHLVDSEVQTNPVTIIDFVPVTVDSTVQYETKYFFSGTPVQAVPATADEESSASVDTNSQYAATDVEVTDASVQQTIALTESFMQTHIEQLEKMTYAQETKEVEERGFQTIVKSSTSGLQSSPTMRNEYTMPSVDNLHNMETQVAADMMERASMTEMSLDDIEELLRIAEKNLVETIKYDRATSPSSIKEDKSQECKLDTKDSDIQTLFETFSRSTSPLLEEMKSIAIQYEKILDMRDKELEAIPETIEEAIETAREKLHSVFTQYESETFDAASETKIDVKDSSTWTPITSVKDQSTQESRRYLSQQVHASPDTVEKGTTSLYTQSRRTATQTFRTESSIWTQYDTNRSTSSVQASVSQADRCNQSTDEEAQMIEPFEEHFEFALPPESSNEGVQTDPVIIRSFFEQDDMETETDVDSGIEVDLQTDPVVVLSEEEYASLLKRPSRNTCASQTPSMTFAHQYTAPSLTERTQSEITRVKAESTMTERDSAETLATQTETPRFFNSQTQYESKINFKSTQVGVKGTDSSTSMSPMKCKTQLQQTEKPLTNTESKAVFTPYPKQTDNSAQTRRIRLVSRTLSPKAIPAIEKANQTKGVTTTDRGTFPHKQADVMNRGSSPVFTGKPITEEKSVQQDPITIEKDSTDLSTQTEMQPVKITEAPVQPTFVKPERIGVNMWAVKREVRDSFTQTIAVMKANRQAATSPVMMSDRQSATNPILVTDKHTVTNPVQTSEKSMQYDTILPPTTHEKFVSKFQTALLESADHRAPETDIVSKSFEAKIQLIPHTVSTKDSFMQHDSYVPILNDSICQTDLEVTPFDETEEVSCQTDCIDDVMTNDTVTETLSAPVTDHQSQTSVHQRDSDNQTDLNLTTRASSPLILPEEKRVPLTDAEIQSITEQKVSMTQTSLQTVMKAVSPILPRSKSKETQSPRGESVHRVTQIDINKEESSSQTFTSSTDFAASPVLPETYSTSLQTKLIHTDERITQNESNSSFSSIYDRASSPKIDLHEETSTQTIANTEDEATETVQVGLDFAGQAQPATIEQSTTTSTTKMVSNEVQVRMASPVMSSSSVGVQHTPMPSNSMMQAEPIMVDEASSTPSLSKATSSAQYSPPGSAHSSPKQQRKAALHVATNTFEVQKQTMITQTIQPVQIDSSNQIRPVMRNQGSHIQTYTDCTDKGTDTKPDISDADSMATVEQAVTSVQCVANTADTPSQYEPSESADISIQVMPTCKDLANSPIFKRKEVQMTATQTDPLFADFSDGEYDEIDYQDVQYADRVSLEEFHWDTYVDSLTEAIERPSMTYKYSFHDELSDEDQDDIIGVDVSIQTKPTTLEMGAGTPHVRTHDRGNQIYPTQQTHSTQSDLTTKIIRHAATQHTTTVRDSSSMSDPPVASTDRASSPIIIDARPMLEEYISPNAEGITELLRSATVERISAPVVISKSVDDEEIFRKPTPQQKPILHDTISPNVVQSAEMAPIQLHQEVVDVDAERRDLDEQVSAGMKRQIRDEVIDELTAELTTSIQEVLRIRIEEEFNEEVRQTVMEEIREEIYEEYREELMVQFAPVLKQEIEDRMREDLRVALRQELEPRIRLEIKEEYIQERVNELLIETLKFDVPQEPQIQVKPQTVERGTLPISNSITDRATQSQVDTAEVAVQMTEIKPVKIDEICQTHIKQTSKSTATDVSDTRDAKTQVHPTTRDRGSTPVKISKNNVSSQTGEMDIKHSGNQHSFTPEVVHQSMQVIMRPLQTSQVTQVKSDQSSRGTSMTPKVYSSGFAQTHVSSESRVVQASTLKRELGVQSNLHKSVVNNQTEAKPSVSEKNTMPIVKQFSSISVQSAKKQTRHASAEPASTNVMDHVVQVSPVTREGASSPLHHIGHNPVTQERAVSPIMNYTQRSETAPPGLESLSPRTTDFMTSSRSPDTKQLKKITVDLSQPHQTRLRLSNTSKYTVYDNTQSVSRLTHVDVNEPRVTINDVIKDNMPPNCRIVLLQQTNAGATYTTAMTTQSFTLSSSTTMSSDHYQMSYKPLSLTSKPSHCDDDSSDLSEPDSLTESDPIQIDELEKIRRDLRMSRVIVSDDQTTLISYLVDKDQNTSTLETTPFSKQPRSVLPRFGQRDSSFFESDPRKYSSNFGTRDPTIEGSPYRPNMPFDVKGSPRSPDSKVLSDTPALSSLEQPTSSHSGMKPTHIMYRRTPLSSPDTSPMVTRLDELFRKSRPTSYVDYGWIMEKAPEKPKRDEYDLPSVEKLKTRFNKRKDGPPGRPADDSPSDVESEVSTTDSETDSESWQAVMDFQSPYLHEDPRFWPYQSPRRTPGEPSMTSSDSEVYDSDDDNQTVCGEVDLNSLRTADVALSNYDNSGDIVRKRGLSSKFSSQLKKELSLSEVVLPRTPTKLTKFRPRPKDEVRPLSSRLSKSEPNLSSKGMMIAEFVPADTRYARVVQRVQDNRPSWGRYSRLSTSENDLPQVTSLHELGKF